ncbi:MAG: hypothetical protein WC841_05230 [Candidatus Shapirobacteria bacterium]
MNPNSNRLYIALGAFSLFALALFQGAQLWLTTQNSQVLGISWQNILKQLPVGSSSVTTVKRQNSETPKVMPMPSGTKAWGWGTTDTSDGGTRQMMGESGQDLAKGIPCETAQKFYGFICEDDELGQGILGMGMMLGNKAIPLPSGFQMPTGFQMPSGVPKVQTGLAQGGGNQYGMGLNCEVFQKVIENQTYCADGFVTKDEIKEIIKANLPEMTSLPVPSKTVRVTQ